MSLARGLEPMLARGLAAGVGRMPWRASLRFGAALGDLARGLGVRRAVAEANLARALPERSREERHAILVEHYRELGRVVCEYPRMAFLAGAPVGEVIAGVEGLEHLEMARRAGRGAILMTGHFGNFELLGAWMARRHPVDFLVKPLSNPGVERLVRRWRRQAGVGVIRIGGGARGVFKALRANRWVAILADQDARRDGIFVPFFGQLSSTPAGPAEFALRTGAPIILGFDVRGPDGRHHFTVLPPLEPRDPAAADAAQALTARHAACLEAWVRRHPAMWFWLHRRWKTPPPGQEEGGAS